MEINPANIQKEIADFKNGIKKRNGPKYKRLTSINDSNGDERAVNMDCIKAAVELAYIDTQRTLRGIGKAENKEKKEAKDKALERIIDKLCQFFHGEAPDSPDGPDGFEAGHKKLCEIWCGEFEGKEEDDDSIFGTYGKAQKIINMAFKYLFCCDDASDFRNHFKYCHMPLDTGTLTWYKRKVDQKKKDYTWSKIKYEEYIKIQGDIRDYLNETEEKPLEKEFTIWPETEKELAAEKFLTGLGCDLPSEEMWKMPLYKKYELIRDILSERIENKTKESE